MFRQAARVLVAVVLLLMPAATRAEQVFTRQVGRVATWSCARDPVVRIAHARGRYVLRGDCKLVIVTGDGSKISIDRTDVLELAGAHNTIGVRDLDELRLAGARDNTIVWARARSGEPKIVASAGSAGNTVRRK